jgi:hypothetical protein
MAVLGKLIGAMKTGASSAISVSSGMANVAGKIAGTVGKIGNFITGGRREQTYGYTSEYFPIRNKKSKLSKTKRVTQIRPRITPLPGMGLMGVGYNAGDEKLSQMFEFMKRTHEQNMTKIEVQNSFAKERANEEANRHRELMSAMRKFTDIETTATIVEGKKEGGGIFDIFKSMLNAAVSGVLATVNGLIAGVKKSLEWLSGLKTLMSAIGPNAASVLARLGMFLVSPVGIALLGALTIAAFLKLISDQKAAIEADPYAIEYKDNPYAMKLRGEAKTVGQAVAVNQRKATRQFKRQEIVEFVKSPLTDAELSDPVNNPGAPGADRATLQKWLDDNPKPGAMFQGSVAAIAGSPETAIPAGGKPLVAPTNNQAEVRKIDNATMVPPTPAPPTPAPPVPPTPVTPTAIPTPSAPVSAPISSAIQENMNLVAEEDTTTSSYTKPVVSVTGSSETTKSPLMSSSATWRDDEPIVDMILQRCRAHV